jgi:hypothetical protein
MPLSKDLSHKYAIRKSVTLLRLTVTAGLDTVLILGGFFA